MQNISISYAIQLTLYVFTLRHCATTVASLRFMGTHTRISEEEATYLVDFSIVKVF